MKRIDKVRRNEHGVTLIELVVVLLITVILFGAAGTVYFAASKVYTRAGNISYKEGTVTNVETNLQNYLAVTTDVEILDNPGPGNDVYYSIGFENGICQEWYTSIVSENGVPKTDAEGKVIYASAMNIIPDISDIKVIAVPKNAGTDVCYTLNYELISTDNTMSVLKGGIAMNNIKRSNYNEPITDLTSQMKSLNSIPDGKFLVLLLNE